MILRIISEERFQEKTIRKVEIVNSRMPAENTFFLPIMSASRPNGSRNIADERMKLLITHPSPIALALRSLPIAGNARLTAEPRNGVRNAANAVTIMTDRLNVFSEAISGVSFMGQFL
jgi:hypothetical protein